MSSAASHVWVDVGDLFNYAGLFRRPSGIQRVVFELGQALDAMDPDGTRVGFVRRGGGGTFAPVAWPQIAALFQDLTDEAPPLPPAPVAHSPAGQAMQVQLEAWRALLAIPRAFRPIRPVMPDPSKRIAASSAMRPGDTLLVAGAGWSDSSLVGRIEAARAQSGIRVALMLHDIIPLRRPEWFDPGNVLRFRLWLDGMLLLSNRLLAVSASTAADVVSYRRRKGLAACEVSVIRLGDGFSQPGAAPPAVETGVEPPYVLFVSTIEVRKNHALLVDVWRRLLERMPLADVPRLVFAGREGALTGDLMRQLRASDNLDGRVILRHAASDADIAALYRNCAFTIFPSLYEGWGLPVAESLAFGKPCLASNATSMPEVGGRLARYFDPLDVEGATQAVASLLRDPAGLAAWQAEVAREFRPASWSRTAEMVLDAPCMRP